MRIRCPDCSAVPDCRFERRTPAALHIFVHPLRRENPPLDARREHVQLVLRAAL